MLDPVDLFNLDVGEKMGNVVRRQLEELRFGPFRIVFYEDYEQLVSQLTQLGQLQSQMHIDGNRLTVEERFVESRYADGWIATARLLHDGSSAESSILAEQQAGLTRLMKRTLKEKVQSAVADQQARDQFALETPELREFFVNGNLGPTITIFQIFESWNDYWGSLISMRMNWLPRKHPTTHD